MSCTCLIKKGFYSVPGGRCRSCRIGAQFDWVTRLKLEYVKRPISFFITLNYSDEFLPVFHCSKKAELYKYDLVSFVKRLRRKLEPGKITVFAVGEYGGYLFGSSKATRPIHPHYHVAVFTDCKLVGGRIKSAAESSWDFGFVHTLFNSSSLINYITGYVTKKFTSGDNINKATGMLLRPEFIYSSRNPAIGDITSELVASQEFSPEEIPGIQLDGKFRRLSRYQKRKLRKELLSWDLDLKNTGDYIIYETRAYFEAQERMQKLREKIEKQNIEYAAAGVSEKEVRRQKILNFESKLQRITTKERVL